MEYARTFMALFDGFPDAYGTYDRLDKSMQKGGKLEIKATARTIREPVTLELWQAHLEGKRSLGVIPIRPDGTCSWGCIDIDRYDLNMAAVVEEIEKRKLPLVACRTKSGGLHLFLFLSQPAHAADLRDVLTEMAGLLGFGGSEIFPKQTQILAERGDVGNWLNMPYLSGNRTDRYAIKKTAAAMTMAEFIEYADEHRQPLQKSAGIVKLNDEFKDGPPCLQYLTTVGFTPGSRNAGLFALGTFAKKKYGDEWEGHLENMNRQFMSPPLPSDEVQEVIKNLKKKNFEYRCKDAPISAHCNSSLCRTRRHGVGNGGNGAKFPAIGGISVLETDPPLWFLDVDGQRIELTTEQLQDYNKFQRRCMEAVHTIYQRLKPDTWLEILGEAMQNVNKISAPPDASIEGHFSELLQEFCMNRYRAESKDDILSGKPWEDEETHKFYFRLRDVMDHLSRAKFEWGRNKVSSTIQKIGGTAFFQIKSRGVNVLWVPSDMFETPVKLDLPKMKETPI
jgi:hypothetical protein